MMNRVAADDVDGASAAKKWKTAKRDFEATKADVLALADALASVCR